MKFYFERLFQFTAWADRRTLAALEATPAAEAEALPLLAHLLAAEHVWLARLEGREPRHAVWPKLNFEHCAALAAENAAGYGRYVVTLDDAGSAAPVRYRNSQGQEFENTPLEILTQVVTHGPYHRGQIAKIIARAGGTALNTDFIMVVRET